ncbi:MAG: hypothetical protein KDK23_08375 [Leptospiraceae bacterium]|nr:hypothetical protein [Leptospiraceae bacterium]
MAVFALLLLLLSGPLMAQAYEGRACKDGNAGIKKLIRSGAIHEMPLSLGITGDGDRWSTSFLKAEGSPPKRMPDYDVELDGDMDIHDWTCMFSAFRAFDKNEDTAWSEGVKGPGIGETLIVPLDSNNPEIRIRPGFAQSDALFKANNRPRKVRLYLLKAGDREATQIGLIYSNWTVLNSKEYVLKDKNAWQTLTLPAAGPEGSSLFLAIEILSVYPGSKYDDTLISEVMN